MSSKLETEVIRLRERLLERCGKKDIIISSDKQCKNFVKLTDPEDDVQQLFKSLQDRRVFIHGINPREWYCSGAVSVVKNTLLSKLSKYLPNSWLRDCLLRRMGIDLGINNDIATNVQFDRLYPRLVSIGNNVIIGYNSVIASHAYFWNRNIGCLCIGEVSIEDYATIGARALIGPGIRIGRYATVTPNSVPYKNVEESTTVIGNPARILK